jgi:hypothetical protein
MFNMAPLIWGRFEPALADKRLIPVCTVRRAAKVVP